MGNGGEEVDEEVGVDNGGMARDIWCTGGEWQRGNRLWRQNGERKQNNVSKNT